MDKHPPTWHRSVRQRYASVNPREGGASERAPADLAAECAPGVS